MNKWAGSRVSFLDLLRWDVSLLRLYKIEKDKTIATHDAKAESQLIGWNLQKRVATNLFNKIKVAAELEH